MATKFMKLKCSKCGAEATVFSHSNKEIHCSGCKALLLQPKGGKAHLVDAEIVEEYNERRDKAPAEGRACCRRRPQGNGLRRVLRAS